jgi:hypothetical protein
MDHLQLPALSRLRLQKSCQLNCQPSTKCPAPVLFYISTLHGPQFRSCCVRFRFRGNVFTEPLLRNDRLFIRRLHRVGRLYSFVSRLLPSNGSIRHNTSCGAPHHAVPSSLLPLPCKVMRAAGSGQQGGTASY